MVAKSNVKRAVSSITNYQRLGPGHRNAPDHRYTTATNKAFDNMRDNPAFIALRGG